MQTHGLMIGTQRMESGDVFLSIKAIGTLTHADYEQINRIVENALAGINIPKINALFDMQELDGWELRAAWDDFRFGLKYGGEFHKIALLGHKKWQEYAAKFGQWFISGEIKFFEDKEQALSWLNAS